MNGTEMLRRSLVVASIAAAALLLAACGNGDEGGVQELDPPEGNGQTGIDEEPDDDGSDGPEDDANGQDSDDTNGAGQDTNGDEPNDDDQDANGSDEDAFAVPDEIDIDYVQSVFDVLMEVNSDHIRDVIARDGEDADVLTGEDSAYMQALYGGPMASTQHSYIVDLLFEEEARQQLLPPDEHGTAGFEVMELQYAGSECVAALGWWDQTETAVEPASEDLYAAFVIARRPDTDAQINPTGWVVWERAALVSGDENEPIQPEEWGDLDVADGLDVTCGADD